MYVMTDLAQRAIAWFTSYKYDALNQGMFDAGVITILIVGFVQVPPSVGISAPVTALALGARLDHIAEKRRIPRRTSVLNVGPLFPDDGAVMLWGCL